MSNRPKLRGQGYMPKGGAPAAAAHNAAERRQAEAARVVDPAQSLSIPRPESVVPGRASGPVPFSRHGVVAMVGASSGLLSLAVWVVHVAGVGF